MHIAKNKLQCVVRILYLLYAKYHFVEGVRHRAMLLYLIYVNVGYSLHLHSCLSVPTSYLQNDVVVRLTASVECRPE